MTVTSPPRLAEAKCAVRDALTVFLPTGCFQVVAMVIETGIPSSVTHAST